jgi:hypothetical protein
VTSLNKYLTKTLLILPLLVNAAHHGLMAKTATCNCRYSIFKLPTIIKFLLQTESSINVFGVFSPNVHVNLEYFQYKMGKLAFWYCRGFAADCVTDCLTAACPHPPHPPPCVPIPHILLSPPSCLASECNILFRGNWHNWYHAPQESFLCKRALFIDSFYARGLISCMHM